MKRRSFIQISSIASVSMLPVVRSLAKNLKLSKSELDKILDGSFGEDLEFHLIDNNLLNLHFYFLNIEKRGNRVRPVDDRKKSFMIVRLPQQHVSERGFWEDDWEGGAKPSANLSAFSYLAFVVWPVSRESQQQTRKSKRMKFSLENILDWNNESLFELITMVEWFDLKGASERSFDFASLELGKPTSVDAFKKRKVWIDRSDSGYETYYERSMTKEPKSEDFLNYKSKVYKLLDQSFTDEQAGNRKEFVPVTFFEVPQGMCLVPIARDDSGLLATSSTKPRKKFWANQLVNSKKGFKSVRKYEIWNNTLLYKYDVPNSNTEIQEKFKIETPSFRAVGLIGNFDIPDVDKSCDGQKETNILPTLLDKYELTYLTQYAKRKEILGAGGENFQGKKFDIKEQNGFLFTGLGIITHLKYDNLEKVPPGMALIEYEHIITQGRDIYVKVARLGYNTKTGQRYKHVIEAKRKIAHKEIPLTDPKHPAEPTSFLELKQYCECIDKVINYDEVGKPINSAEYHGIPNQSNAILTPASDTNNKCDFKRNTYKVLKTIEKERIPIRCLTTKVHKQNVCELQKLGWFWPTRENATRTDQQGKNVNYEDYLPCIYEGLDWEGAKISAKTPFMFIRSDFIEKNNLKNPYVNYFSGDFNRPDEKNLIKRRKTFFPMTKIAFTRTPISRLESKKAELQASYDVLIATNTDASLQLADSVEAQIIELNDEVKTLSDDIDQSTSKTNIQETEFVEHYFYVKTKASFTDNKIAKTKYVVFPQVLRAKVFTDHVRDIALKSIPSVIEYHQDYLNHEFSSYSSDPTAVGGTSGNGAKVILANTNAFIATKEEAANQTYNDIKKAIQRSKNQLGNLAVPDIIPDTLSLEKFGVTLPKEIGSSIQNGRTVLQDAADGLRKIASFNPRELLRGKLSDVCGLDLTAVLDELIPSTPGNNQTPLFEINKILNKIEGEVLNSPVYKSIVNFTIEDPLEPGVRLSPSALIDKYEDIIKGFRNQLEAKRLELNAKIKELSNLIPNGEELDNMVKGLYEMHKANAIAAVNEEFPFLQVAFDQSKIKEVLSREVKILKDELVDQKNEIDKFMSDIVADLESNKELTSVEFATLKTKTETILNSTVKSIRDKIDHYSNPSNYKTLLDKQLNLFAKVGAERVFKNGSEIYVNLKTFEFVPKPEEGVRTVEIVPFKLMNNVAKGGLIQVERKVNDLRLVVSKNVSGAKFQREAVEKIQRGVYKSYTDKLKQLKKNTEDFADVELGNLIRELKGWEVEINREIQSAIASGLSPETQDLIRESSDNIMRLASYVDTLRKIDPYFLFKEQKELQKEVKDVERRFKKGFFEEYDAIKSEILVQADKYLAEAESFESAINALASGQIGQDEYNGLKQTFIDNKSSLTQAINAKSKDILDQLKNTREYQKAARTLKVINGPGGLKDQVEDLEGRLKSQLDNYKKILQQQGTQYKKELDARINDFLKEQEDELRRAVGQQNIDRIQNNINEAKNIYRLITSIKKQDLSYNWNTDKFRDFSLGIVKFRKFSGPDTTLNVDVKATTYFTPGKFPPTIDRIITYSENRFSNFGVTFFNALTIGFKEVSFIAGSDQSTHFDVQIRDVKFDGALSFVQAFESWLKTMGKGLILQLHGDHVSLGYSFPIPSIVTPSFSIFNISINFDLRLFYDSRPMLCGFQLSRKGSKFGIAAGIFAGFGFFGIAADTKGGIVAIECALEAGVWAGIRLGPISGEVKLAFGFYYRKSQSGVRLEGYIVLEGRLSVWIISVSARVYLGVVSQNSYVEGVCTVTYSAKLGFVKKSFSGSFRKRVAGAENNNRGAARDSLNKHLIQFLQVPSESTSEYLNEISEAFNTEIATRAVEESFNKWNDGHEVLETEPVSEKNWKKFISTF